MANIKNRTEGGKLKHHWINDNALTVATVYGSATGLVQITAYHSQEVSITALCTKEVCVTVPKGCKVTVKNL